MRSCSSRSVLSLALAGLSLAGCGDAPSTTEDAAIAEVDAGANDAALDASAPEPSPEPRGADTVTRAPGATGTGVGDPQNAVNGVRGGGDTMGSLDVYSLDYADRSELVLEWAGHEIENGPGVDFVVFENAFRYAGDVGNFMDPTVVWVSRDGERWVALPHRYLADDPSRYSIDPDDWEGFAGVHPVALNDDSNPVDPFDPAAGGDAFDLDALPLDGADAELVRREGFVYLRLTAAAIEIDPTTGMRYPRDPISSGPDIDGVVARWLTPRSSR